MIKNLIQRIITKSIVDIKNSDFIEKILLNQGKILENIYSSKKTNKLSDYEWKIFSQWGEDGIIQFLISQVNIKNKTFIEFGVEDFFESNCRFLLMNSNWKGFVIDGSTQNINRLKNSSLYWKYDLQAIDAFVNVENINNLLKMSAFDSDLGILSVDIDGNDYHILSAINSFKPRIIISEFNPVFGSDMHITVPYDENFNRTEKHFSNLYFGASIMALDHLLNSRGYKLIGTGMLGGNAYFVRDDLINQKLLDLSQNAIQFNGHASESRDINGNLNYLRGKERLNSLKGLPVLNVLTNKIQYL